MASSLSTYPAGDVTSSFPTYPARTMASSSPLDPRPLAPDRVMRDAVDSGRDLDWANSVNFLGELLFGSYQDGPVRPAASSAVGFGTVPLASTQWNSSPGIQPYSEPRLSSPIPQFQSASPRPLIQPSSDPFLPSSRQVVHPSSRASGESWWNPFSDDTSYESGIISKPDWLQVFQSNSLEPKPVAYSLDEPRVLGTRPLNPRQPVPSNTRTVAEGQMLQRGPAPPRTYQEIQEEERRLQKAFFDYEYGGPMCPPIEEGGFLF